MSNSVAPILHGLALGEQAPDAAAIVAIAGSPLLLGLAAAVARAILAQALVIALIGASNFFDLAVAAAISLFGLRSGAAFATVVGVLVELPVMLSVVAIVKRSKRWYMREGPVAERRQLRAAQIAELNRAAPAWRWRSKIAAIVRA